MAEEAALLEVQDLVVEYKTGRSQTFCAVDGVSFDVFPGQTVGLVGESGSGKSSIGKAVLGLVAPAAGSIRFAGRGVLRPALKTRRQLARELQVVFQDPNSSLNPTRTIGSSLVEPMLVQRGREKGASAEAQQTARAMLARVGLSSDAMERYPSAFSGGQRQRIAIARALVMQPKLIICDEPVSALDLSVQAQVLNLMVELQLRDRLSYLFISHDLSVVRHMSHHVLVLQNGRVVEQGSGDQLWNAPAHPYTRALIDSVPEPDPRKHERGEGESLSSIVG